METSGLNHIILTIGNIDKSRTFYSDLLGFNLKEIADGFFFVTGNITIFLFPSVQPIKDDKFSEFRIGLDHLAFTAPDEVTLYSIAEKLISAGVDTKGVETYHTGNKYIAFLDPDNIQLEYWLP
jgi:glyoxylase I family protein